MNSSFLLSWIEIVTLNPMTKIKVHGFCKRSPYVFQIYHRLGQLELEWLNLVSIFFDGVDVDLPSHLSVVDRVMMIPN